MREEGITSVGEISIELRDEVCLTDGDNVMVLGEKVGSINSDVPSEMRDSDSWKDEAGAVVSVWFNAGVIALLII